MSPDSRIAGDTRDRLEQRYLELKEQRDDLCRDLAGWCGVYIAPGSDPVKALEPCREAAEVCHNTEKLEIIDRISNDTLDMRKLQELLRAADAERSHFVI
ncbi:hypothetical protein Enr13x_41050 [Stieleria neptunia]|uniref:Uncharacterized protein n=1 Tax=Stieleria neptunia TaxID=2527979 RepID=A0A518HTW4_9BACT|nr:hypothetical protein [Stieleria neptunia]QDV44243.1 hypothetical protein Enr13x_41050 [Stieleria neptunia]